MKIHYEDIFTFRILCTYCIGKIFDFKQMVLIRLLSDWIDFKH
jgi:hypothetical protein